jgi:hypothetical protein
MIVINLLSWASESSIFRVVHFVGFSFATFTSPSVSSACRAGCGLEDLADGCSNALQIDANNYPMIASLPQSPNDLINGCGAPANLQSQKRIIPLRLLQPVDRHRLLMVAQRACGDGASIVESFYRPIQ